MQWHEVLWKWHGAAWETQRTHNLRLGLGSSSENIYLCEVHKDVHEDLRPSVACPVSLIIISWTCKSSTAWVTSDVMFPEFHSKVFRACHFSVTMPLVVLLLSYPELCCRMWVKLGSFWKSCSWEEQARGNALSNVSAWCGQPLGKINE